MQSELDHFNICFCYKTLFQYFGKVIAKITTNEFFSLRRAELEFRGTQFEKH